MEGELGHFRHKFEVQMGRVWEAILTLVEAQQRTEERVERLEAVMERLEATVQTLADAVGRLTQQP